MNIQDTGTELRHAEDEATWQRCATVRWKL